MVIKSVPSPNNASHRLPIHGRSCLFLTLSSHRSLSLGICIYNRAVNSAHVRFVANYFNWPARIQKRPSQKVKMEEGLPSSETASIIDFSSFSFLLFLLPPVSLDHPTLEGTKSLVSILIGDDGITLRWALFEKIKWNRESISLFCCSRSR